MHLKSTPWTSDETEKESVKASEREKEKKSHPASFTIFSVFTFTNLDMRVCRRSPNIPGKAMSSRTVLLREEGP